ncbi:MAG: DUF1553 domain-containing protein [Planctomycetaceae bacterium]|nr:DUF1553 domain-containing protein [Planctomycetaceae bacterium]
MPVAALILLLAMAAAAGDEPTLVDYTSQIKPILTERCLACHGALKQAAGLRLDTGAAARAGGDSGPALVPGHPADSVLIQRISAADLAERMPPEGHPLTAEQIALLTAWVQQNAESPADEQPEADPRDHWAFRPVERPPVPTVAATQSVQNPIDAFLAAEHERRGLAPLPAAPSELLLRRVYIDLIGLPPTRDELQAWLRDPSPAAYAAIVDDLLNRPQHGERWARHWMDVWRYSDWYGRRHVPDVWNSAPQVWRWRDWIVNSLNADHGYDRMVREMLAADEIAPTDYDAAVATDYLVRNWYALNPNNWMRDNVEHTGKAFLGLTFNCCHCHDHKYDPLTQDEYFNFRAFFETIGVRQDRVVGEPEPGAFVEYQYSVLRKIERLGAVKIFDKTPDAKTWFYTGGDERNRIEARGSMPPAVPAFLPESEFSVRPVELPTIAYYPGLRPEIQQQELQAATASVAEAEAACAAARSAAEPLADELAALRTKVDEAEAAFVAARAAAGSGALHGRQSLVLDATTGRRILQNPLANIFPLDSGAQLRFELLVLKDAHFNFQLARDVQAGLTASAVVFENGAIQAYKPGTFDLFQAGAYSIAAGQTRMEVALTLDRSGDQCRLTVRSVPDGQLLVDEIPIALNGWNPPANPLQAITLDARPGAIVAVDNLVVQSAAPQSDGTGILTFDFEQPLYSDGQDIVGVSGWVIATLADAGAKSYVTTTIDSEPVIAERQVRDAAQSALDARQLPLVVAEQKLVAAQANQASLAARIAADRVRYGIDTGDADALTRAASAGERAARVATCEANRSAARLTRAQAALLPADNAERAQQIDAAAKPFSDAETALAAARTAFDDPAQATTYTPLSPVYPAQSTGRRRALAEWIANDNNPLTPRVAVNHIWLRHFQSALVDTVYNLGRNGSAPTHPDLINWLAAELIDNGWSMKHLHRLIVTSAAYQRQSGVAPDDAAVLQNVSVDPDNRYLWRMNSSRMESEIVRDSILSIAGSLDRTLGGQELENTETLTTFRRSLYYAVHPEAGGMSEMGKLFDAPDPTECYRRTKTVVPQQALALTNSTLIHAQSIAVATRLAGETASVHPQPDPDPDLDALFVATAFEEILTRAPTDAELTRCRAFLEQQRQQAQADSTADTEAAARASLIRVLFNHNDFVTVR